MHLEENRTLEAFVNRKKRGFSFKLFFGLTFFIYFIKKKKRGFKLKRFVHSVVFDHKHVNTLLRVDHVSSTLLADYGTKFLCIEFRVENRA